MWMRPTVAFVVAPAVGALAVSLVAVRLWSFYFIGFFFSALITAYAVALVVGVPAFLISRAWLPTSVTLYAIAGAVVASVAAVPMAFIFPLSLALLSIAAGAIAGVAFAFILMPTSNNRWRGP